VTFTAALRKLGWSVTAIEDVYAGRAERTPDEEWVDHGSRMGWALLTKDKRIRWRPAYEHAKVPIFALSDGNLINRVMVERFDRFRRRIWRSLATVAENLGGFTKTQSPGANLL
jgi:hypothetical protein